MSISVIIYPFRNQSSKYLEHQHRKVSYESSIDQDAGIEKSIITAETARELNQLISTLSSALQQIIRLYYLEEKSTKKISAHLNLQQDTITRQRLSVILALRKTKVSL